MHVDRTSCVHRGATFFGEYHMVDDGLEAVVRVRYTGEAVAA